MRCHAEENEDKAWPCASIDFSTEITGVISVCKGFLWIFQLVDTIFLRISDPWLVSDGSDFNETCNLPGERERRSRSKTIHFFSPSKISSWSTCTAINSSHNVVLKRIRSTRLSKKDCLSASIWIFNCQEVNGKTEVLASSPDPIANHCASIWLVSWPLPVSMTTGRIVIEQSKRDGCTGNHHRLID